MLKIGRFVDRLYVISIHPVISSEKVSFWSLSWETFKNKRGYFYSGWGGAGPGPGPGAGNPATSACIAATSWAKKVAPAGGGPASPTGPTGPGSPSGSGGASPPPGPPAPPPSGTGAAISNIQCNNKLNPTLLVDSQSVESSPYCLCKCLGHLYAFVGLWIASDPGRLL